MRRNLIAVGCAGIALALLAGGCAGDGRQAGDAGVSQADWLQQPPPFLDGPSAILLTNVQSFSAQATLAVASPDAGTRTLSGYLLEKNGRLFFEPIPDSSAGERALRDGFSFIWDTATGRGFVLSEALQGYAPAGGGNRFPLLVIRNSGIPPSRFQDHPVNAASALCASTNGTQASFQLLCASDLNGLALRIESTNEPDPFTLTLSKIRLDRLPDHLFLPPEGFTKYPSDTAMARELAIREQRLRGQPREWHSVSEPDFPGRGAGSPGGPESVPGTGMGP